MADEVVRESNQHVEVVGLDGKEAKSGAPLADIFAQIEEGKAEGKSPEEVLKQAPIVQETREGATKETGTKSLVTPEVKKVEPKEEKKEPAKEEKKEPTSLEQKLEKQQEVKDEEVTRESLRKKTEEKAPEVKKEEKKEPDAKTDDDVTDDDLVPLPHDKPKTVKRIQALLKKIDEAQSVNATTVKQVAEKDAKLKELEAELGKVKSVDPKTDEAVKAQMDELSMLRRKYELERDPEVKTKFDSKIDSAETSIMSLLKDKGASEPLLELIKTEGGWSKFASSTKTITLSDGSKTTAAQLAETITGNLPYGDRKVLEASATEQVQIKRDKDRYLKEQQETASKYFEEREANWKKIQEENKGKMAHIQTVIKDSYDRAIKDNDWLQEKSVPTDASPEVKASIEDDNKYTKQLQALLKKSLATTDVKEAVEITFDSVRYYEQRRQNQRLQAQIDGLKKELEAKAGEMSKFKQAGRSVPKGGSISVASAAPTQTNKPASLEDAFNRISGGEVLVSNEA